MTLERGALLHNRYRIVEILGEGGMGAVYRAVDENLAIEVAVKENFFTSEEYARQFRREANILASMRHSNLPRVTDHFVIKGQGQYLVLDYIEGEDLRERIDRLGVLPEEDVIVLGVAICEALAYFHKRTPPILHRDIKPGNVKITPSGEVYLVDFGLAKIVQGTRETTPGARAMTPGYSPPEQYGTARTDRRTDVYSLGATLYEALTGVIPEDGLGRLMEQVDLVPVRKRNPEVSRKLAAVIENAMSVHPEDRYQTADQFKNALIAASRGTTRKQVSEGGLIVSPPPTVAPDGPVNEAVYQDAPDMLAEPEIEAPFSVSTPIDAPPSFQPAPRKRTGWGRWILVIALGLLIGSGAGAFLFFPELSAETISLIAPGGSAMETEEPIPTALSRGGSNEQSQGPSPTRTASPRPSATPTTAPSGATPSSSEAVVMPPPTETPTPRPTPLGGGMGQVAFASDRTGIPQIWIVNVDGTGLRQITDRLEGACQPSWAPDGERLVFISPCRSNQEIYPNSSLFIINADGSDITPLPTILGGDFDPDWSPDGNFIVFTSLRNGNRNQVHVMDLRDLSVKLLSEEFVQDLQPAWSADGEQIAFVSTRKGPFQLWTMDPNGSSQELFSRSASARNTNPVWSPDGSVIVFDQSKGLGEVPTLFAARFEEGGMNEFRIFENWIPSREADYSPDGFWLVFESWPDGRNHDIYMMTANGVDRQPLTTDPGFDFDPAWRPAN
jgi:serine/threonine protein kinase